MSDDEIEAVFGPDEPAEDGAFGVWEENWLASEVFLALSTQWIVRSGLWGESFQGIRYSSVQPVLWAFGVKDRRAVFEDVRVMEAAALGVFNKRDA